MLFRSPPTLIIDGKTYDLTGGKCNESSKMFSNWWWYKYVDSSKNPDMPIQAADNGSMYYLCAMQETKEKAIEDMLERLNSMVEIVTEETLEKEKKAWEKLKKDWAPLLTAASCMYSEAALLISSSLF